MPWFFLRELSVPLYAWVLLAGLGVGVWACGVAGRVLGVADHRSVVWDEFIGQWLALLPLVGRAELSWWGVAVGFVSFRVFDIWKPWPIGWLDRRLKGGLGVMADDLVAGICAAAVLATGLRLLGH